MKKMNMKYLVVLCLLLLCGCHIPNFDDENFTKSKPKNEDLVGKYVPTAETLKLVREEGKYRKVETSIELFKDGSLKMVNMPDWWLKEFGESKGGFESGVGTWDVREQQGRWELGLDIKGLVSTSIPIADVPVPYLLWFYVGDPDQGKVMIFEKKPADKQ